jgi:hypothetical protein
MAVSEKAWGQFSASDYSDAGSYCDAALINENTGPRSGWSKAACKLPVKEPNGDLNINGVHAAAARLAGAGGGVQASPASKRSAARALVTLYRKLNQTPPDSIVRMAQ